MHRRKTGALIQGSVLLGATAAGFAAARSSRRCSATARTSGSPSRSRTTSSTSRATPACSAKSTGADAARSKPTYPSTAGLDAARAGAPELRDSAIAALAPLG